MTILKIIPRAVTTQVRMKNCFREANMCVDALARMRSYSSQNFMFFDSTPVDLCMLLLYNTSGLYYERQWPPYADFV